MNLAAALIYWVIVALWLTVLVTLVIFFVRNPRAFGTTRLLLAVVAVDTSRNVIENAYFGIYFGGQYGIFPTAVVGVLGQPMLLILPKIINVIAGCVVLGLLLFRWLPSAVREHRTLKKNADDALRLSSMMDEFVADVSHELRTPLTSIAGSLGLLAAGVAGNLPVAAIRLVSIAHDNAQRLVRLINDLLDIGKIESGTMTFDFAPIDLRAATERTIDATRAFAQGHGVSVRLDIASANCLVRADSDRLTQVLTNLLSNAIKFSPSGEEVVVAIEQSGRTGRVTVRDHGSGIPEEFKSRIFGKFAQAKGDNARQKVGSGLGLNIVAKIVAQHGGNVGFEDAAAGGTLFFFETPLWETGAARASAQSPAQLTATAV